MKILLILISFFFSSFIDKQAFPDIQVEKHTGEMMQTTSLVDGKTPFILSFWSSTCAPCIKELDAVSEVLEDWLETAEFRVVVVSVDNTRSKARAKALASSHGWDGFSLLYDVNQDFMRAMNVVYIPQVFVFDKDGKQVYAHTGYNPGNERELIDVLKAMK